MRLEIKIPKEVRQHKETIFFGLSAGKRVFRSEDLYYRALGRKEADDFD